MTTAQAVARDGYVLDPTRPLWRGGELLAPRESGVESTGRIAWWFGPRAERSAQRLPTSAYRLPPRECQCGCGTFQPTHHQQRWASHACQNRVYRKGEAAKAKQRAYMRIWRANHPTKAGGSTWGQRMVARKGRAA